MKKTKKCSGCKEVKGLENFYKNKLTLDGRSNYCITCTKENSRKYHQRKKERINKVENDNLMKMVLLQNYPANVDNTNADSLMKILLIERHCKLILEEIGNLKKTLIPTDITVSR